LVRECTNRYPGVKLVAKSNLGAAILSLFTDNTKNCDDANFELVVLALYEQVIELVFLEHWTDYEKQSRFEANRLLESYLESECRRNPDEDWNSVWGRLEAEADLARRRKVTGPINESSPGP
jgi:TnpA family transposase